jgi:hypothetical protein
LKKSPTKHKMCCVWNLRKSPNTLLHDKMWNSQVGEGSYRTKQIAKIRSDGFSYSSRFRVRQALE